MSRKFTLYTILVCFSPIIAIVCTILVFIFLVLNINDFIHFHVASVKCPNCLANATETLVIRGKLCPVCGCACG